MNNFLLTHQSLLNLCLLNALLAQSQYIVLRAGVFSVATSGIAAIGAYMAGYLMLRQGVHPALATLAAGVAGMLASSILALPLVRLRGVFQAIATLAFVQIVMSLVFYAERFTGGATGLNGIAKSVDTWQLLAMVAAVSFVLAQLGRSTTGLAFDTIRQDETVAASLGINVVRHHMLAFAMSGFIAGVAGAMMAAHNYALAPGEFGFGMMIAVLSYVVLGGRRSVAGPLVGAIMLTVLPEIARPLAENRMIIYGGLLIVTIIFLPDGVVDTWMLRRHRRHRAEDAARRAAEPRLEAST
jgi:branched-chain amino acid transport system permease protein